jgi:hypothetical protein
MTLYWLLFAAWAAGAILHIRRSNQQHGNVLFAAAAVATALMIGLRFEVGGDWSTYQNMFEQILFQPLGEALIFTDPAYGFLNWLGGRLDLSIAFPNLLCAIVFMAGTGRLASRQPNPWLAVLVAVPYLVIVVAMGYTRQAAAIGVVSWAVADARPDHMVRLCFAILVAALFHKTAILILPILLLPILRRNMLAGLAGGVLFVLLFVAILASSSDQMVQSYANSNYDSQGAAIRISMNVLPAIIFLLLRQRISMPPFQKSFWTASALLALASVPALVSVSASSGVDRLSLFLIPLQMIVYSRLPYILSAAGKAQINVLIGVVGYAFAVQFVWLNYAVNARLWIPYVTVFNPADV